MLPPVGGRWIAPAYAFALCVGAVQLPSTGSSTVQRSSTLIVERRRSYISRHRGICVVFWLYWKGNCLHTLGFNRFLGTSNKLDNDQKSPHLLSKGFVILTVVRKASW